MKARAPGAHKERALPAPSADARVVARAVLCLLLLLAAIFVGWQFLTALAWAVVVTIAAWPGYRRFVLLFAPERRDLLAPLLFTIILAIVIFLPLGIALGELATAGDLVLRVLAEFREKGIPAPGWLTALPFGEAAANWWSHNLSDPENARHFLGDQPAKEAQAAWTRGVGFEILHRVFLLIVSLSATFALLRTGAVLGDRVLDLADRIFGDPGERLARKLVETVRGTVNGTVLVAVAEGIIIGAGYAVAGVPRPLLFALLTAAFAMVPLGAWAVFSFAALILAHQGELVAAFGIFAFGAVVMLIGDIFVWPWLIGNQARLPFLVALIGVFGGVHVFGLVGLFAGPALLAAVWIVVRDWLLRAQPRGS